MLQWTISVVITSILIDINKKELLEFDIHGIVHR